MDITYTKDKLQSSNSYRPMTESTETHGSESYDDSYWFEHIFYWYSSSLASQIGITLRNYAPFSFPVTDCGFRLSPIKFANLEYFSMKKDEKAYEKVCCLASC